jgi:hypothetical protein
LAPLLVAELGQIVFHQATESTALCQDLRAQRNDSEKQLVRATSAIKPPSVKSARRPRCRRHPVRKVRIPISPASSRARNPSPKAKKSGERSRSSSSSHWFDTPPLSGPQNYPRSAKMRVRGPRIAEQRQTALLLLLEVAAARRCPFRSRAQSESVARHKYQLATVRYGFQRRARSSSSALLGSSGVSNAIEKPFCTP